MGCRVFRGGEGLRADEIRINVRIAPHPADSAVAKLFVRLRIALDLNLCAESLAVEEDEEA